MEAVAGRREWLFHQQQFIRLLLLDLSRVSERIEGGVKWKVVDGINKNVEFIVGV